MKKMLFFLIVCSALVIGSATLISNAASGKQKANFRFNDPVVLKGVVLKGEYLFVHDDAAMQRGEACTYVYKGNAEIASRLVVSFHCVPTQRTKAAHFMVRTVERKDGTVELLEYQFSGDTESHLVPDK